MLIQAALIRELESLLENRVDVHRVKQPLDYSLTFSLAALRCLTMETLTIRLPDDLRDNLQKLSEEQNKPVSDIVRESIRRYVAVERFRALRKKVLPFAEAQGFLTDEDIFKEV